MKENICTAAGIIGGFFAALLGGWDSALITLVLFMAIDFTTGLIAASMGRSKHSKTGRLSSKACEEILHSAHGGCGSENGHSYWHDLHP